jgi:hypothetical protein
MRIHPHIRLAALALAALVLFGCSSGDDAPPPEPPHVQTALDVEAARAAATGTAPGAQGAGPMLEGDAALAKQLPADVKEALKGEIRAVAVRWRVGLGTFRVDELGATGARPAARPDGAVRRQRAGEDLRLLHLAMPSPGGTTLLDPYVDWTLTSDGTTVRAVRDGDPTVELIDLKNRVRQRLFDARQPYGRIDGAIWLDETASRFSPPSASRRTRGSAAVLYLVDLSKESVTRYEGPPLDFEGFKLVEKDLERRFRKNLPDVLFS